MSLTNQNTEELITACKLGNQRAQLEVYNRYYKAMYNTSFRIVKDSFKAEDIMQDSFLTAFTKLDSLKEIKTFGSWLKRIVINNSILDYNKKTNNIPLDDVLYKVQEQEDESVFKDDLTSVKAKQILEGMNTLKDNYRIGLSLHFIEGYDYEEICDIMNISYANCRTMISRAKTSLRQKLEPTG
ncbi:RNA polymerase sigma factor [Ichthyenterobacterium sp. W332]|uniref:RNA polymerase sigma factor n=1 Tax=Microcosmobacter mediterraneus TaxID=3075607 RepID=A0ABU2YI01_9FLAO|nr:RNA polymerase sigma factor [Ichthyenterobacterium sp. W332]MDT0557652.1 RNA polymerase sigma factor [Ichthyenterobacterium sp. W332]